MERKEEIIEAMYQYLREMAKKRTGAEVDYGELVKGKDAYQILSMEVLSYLHMNEEEGINQFYKIVYSERSFHKEAANIMVEETKRMILSTKLLFYAMQVHGLLQFADVDYAATSFAMAVHALIDYYMDCKNAGHEGALSMIENYIQGFVNQYRVSE